MSDDTEIELILEADASQGVRAAREMANQVSGLYNQFKQIEKLIGKVLGPDIKAGAASLRSLTGELRALEQRTQALSRLQTVGGTAGLTRASATRGVIRGLQDDPIVLGLKQEQEVNKALQARVELYRRLKQALPGASDAQLLRAYQSAGASLLPKATLRSGATEAEMAAATAARRKFLAESARVQTEFNAREIAENQKAYERDLANFENTLRQKARALAKYEGEALAKQRDGYLERAFNQTSGGRKINPTDRTRLGGYLDQQINEAKATYVAPPPRDARPGMTPEERIAASIKARNDRLTYKGGAPTLLAEAHTLGNYALIGGAISGAYKTAEDLIKLQEELRAVQAATGSTDEQMQKLSNDILNVGTSSSKSLADLTEATTVLAKAGYSAENLGSALKIVAQAATATHTSAKDVAQTTTDVIDSFRLSTQETASVEAIIANLAIKSKISVEDLGKAVKMSGQFAEASGVSFREYSAAMAAMAASGMHDGQQIGQGLRQLISALDNPNKKMLEELAKLKMSQDDISVSSNGLAGALENLKSHGMTASEAMTVFNTRTFAAFNALSGHLEVMRQQEKEIDSTSTLFSAAAANANTLAAAWERLANTFSKVANDAFRPLMNSLQGIVEGLTALIKVAGMAAPALSIVGTVLGVLAALRLTQWLAGLVGGFLKMGAASDAAAAASLGLSAVIEGDLIGAFTALNLAIGPVGWIVIGLSAVMLVMGKFIGMQNAAGDAARKWGSAASEAGGRANEYKEKIDALNHFTEVLANRTGNAGSMAEEAASRFSAWGLQLSSTKVTVNELAGAVAELTRRMEAQRALELKKQSDDLGKQSLAVGKQISDADKALPLSALSSQLQGDKSRRGQFNSSVLNKITAGTATADDYTAFALQWQQAQSRSPGDKFYSKYGEAVTESVGLRKQQSDINNARAGVDSDYKNTSIRQSNDYQLFSVDAQSALKTITDAQSAALRNNPAGPGRAAALRGVATQADQLYDKLAQRARTTGKSLFGDAGASVFLSTPQLANLQARGTHPNDPAKDAKYRLGSLRAQMANEKDPKKLADMADQGAQLEIQSHGGDLDADEEQSIIDKWQAQLQGKTDRLANHAARQGRKDSGKDADRIKLEIEQLRDNFSLKPGDEANETNQLTSKLGEYKAAKLDTADSAAARQAIEEEVQKYAGEVLKGNALAIREASEKAASIAADKAKGSALLDVSQGGSLAEAMDHLDVASGDLLKARIETIRAKYGKEHPLWNGKDNAALLSQINEAAEKAATDLLTAKLTLIRESYTAGLSANRLTYQRSISPLEARSAQLGAASNYFNQGQVGSTHSWMLDQEQRRIDVQIAGHQLANAQNDRDSAATQVANLQKQIDGAGGLAKADKDLATSFQAANKELEQQNEQLERAENNYTRLTTKVPPLATGQDALRAALTKYQTEAGLNRGVFEDVADGLDGTLQRSQQAMATFFTDATSGTKKVGVAFRDMGMAVLQSLQQMAAQILARQIFKLLIQLGMNFLSPGAPGVGASDLNLSPGSGMMFASVGGMVKKFAAGGVNTDSVPAMLMPGEFILRKSAVDFMGLDNVRAMNAAANSRVSRMPNVSQAMKPRAPDTTNVYVVAPGQTPQLGKNDILHVIGDDILSGGQTKKLIKAVAMGVG